MNTSFTKKLLEAHITLAEGGFNTVTGQGANTKVIQLGMDVDSKITGYSGEGTMKLKQVYTRFYEVLDEARRGVDKRCTITTALKDPDSVDGQEERYASAGVAFTELPFINYKIGEVNGQSLPFTFRPSELKSLDAIGVGE